MSVIIHKWEGWSLLLTYVVCLVAVLKWSLVRVVAIPFECSLWENETRDHIIIWSQRMTNVNVSSYIQGIYKAV